MQDFSHLSPEEKRALLAKLLVAQSKNKMLAMSFAQERLWFLDRLEPMNFAYNISTGFVLEGNLNLEYLEQSINEIAKRHESLRTSFEIVANQTLQVIKENRSLSLTKIDLSQIPVEKQEAEVSAICLKEASEPFDLSSWPLLKVKLFFLSENKHILLFVFHHIISDNWSISLFLQELQEFYQSFYYKKEAKLNPLKIQYSDFSAWQREYLKGEILEKELNYWKSKLSKELSILNLATDKPRPEIQSYKGGNLFVTIPIETVKQLKDICAKEKVSLFILLLTAFSTLLYKYTGQTDILIGTPVANRTRSELEDLIGLLINMLVLRIDLSGEPTFLELLKRVREVVLDAYNHQEIPVEKLAEELQPRRSLSIPFVQASFSLNQASPELTLAELTVTPLIIHNKTAKIDLNLELKEINGTLTGIFNYSADLFNESTIKQISLDFENLLKIIINSPQKSIKLFPNLILPGDKKYSLNNVYEKTNLSQNQLLVWLGQKLYKDKPLYNIPIYAIINSEINIEKIKEAFQIFVNKSDALRTIIKEEQGVGKQVVLETLNYTLDYFDFSQDLEANKKLEEWMKERSEENFTLDKIMFYSALVKLGENKLAWYLNIHHLIGDGWSGPLIFEYVVKIYSYLIDKSLDSINFLNSFSLPQFQDYLLKEREEKKSDKYLIAEKYWQNKLSLLVEPIIFYGQNKEKKSVKIKRIKQVIGIEKTNELKAISKEENISIFNMFAGLFFTYLHKVSNHHLISVGIPFHNRRSKVFKQTVGPFMEVLPLQTSISKDETFLSLIKKLKVETFEVLRHDIYSVNNPTYQRNYDVFLNYHSEGQYKFNFNDFPVEVGWVATGYETYNLALQIHDFGLSESLTLDFDFNEELFDNQQQTWVIEHFTNLLNSFSSSSLQTKLKNISLLSPKEKEHILFSFNKNKKEVEFEKNFAELFSEQVRKNPEKVAAIHKDKQLSYKELNFYANKCAQLLIEKGVGIDNIVGLFAKRGLELLISILGVFKAGASYLPLDPFYPAKRLSYILKHSQTKIILVSREMKSSLIKNLEELSKEDSPEIVEIEDLLEKDIEVKEIKSLAKANSLAYVIYTSGSTGQPKGAMVENKGMINHLFAKVLDLGLRENDYIAQTASQCFDISVWQFLSALIVGGRVEIIDDEIVLEPLKLLNLVSSRKISILEIVPSLLSATLNSIDKDKKPDLSQLRWLIVTGEAFAPELCRKWMQEYPEILVMNAYGPTECSDDVTHYLITEKLPKEMINMPIGSPIINMQLYVLDENLLPQPIGVVGEVYVSGVGVGRGYLKDPQKTASTFLPNPFSNSLGERLYKTGDLGKWLRKGEIEFLGRIDHQIKVRGFRIELGEIESVIREYKEIKDVVVVAKDLKSENTKTNQENIIVGYIVATNQEFSTAKLKTFMQSRLPEYMIPTIFMVLGELPLNANGKVDRALLPQPKFDREKTEKYIEPTSKLEQEIANIWQDLLKIEKIGINDNFFDIGGHSLLLVQVQNKLKDLLAIDIPLMEMFRHPTISSLSSFLILLSNKPDTPDIDDFSEVKERARKRITTKRPRPQI